MVDVIDEYQAPEFDCDRTIGIEKYYFYTPVEIGDFVITIWTREQRNNPTSSWGKLGGLSETELKFSVSIYENGKQITRYDPRVRQQKWANKLQNSWSEEVYTKKDVEEILKHLNLLSPRRNLNSPRKSF